ncbi:hypothetical protein HAPAU_40890 [Halalkalicoccus paucihalophilus]|uniref:Uncharacterized protein n=1 Tax=Halalkalicoccus paucihalophilus TaxID=1008153 RepID=A0A151A8X1_9EURY|nr:hypothetical protein [Halalkalicoccus paucihalophilus]KYH24010.1 hypothetical protein HAPAU_40890 [Halalkalicoccus paucihalophilus]
MAVANLRRADTAGPTWEGLLPETSTENLSIEFVESEPAEPLCENYPFDQQIHKGTAIYKEPSQYTSGRNISLDFEFRDGSNLLIIELKTDVTSIDSIYSSLADIVPTEITIYRNLHAAEDSLWDFFSQADRILKIHVLDNGFEVPYQEIEGVDKEDVIGNYAIETATVGFQYQDESILVKYDQGKLQIEASSEEGREYIIQVFEREVLADS